MVDSELPSEDDVPMVVFFPCSRASFVAFNGVLHNVRVVEVTPNVYEIFLIIGVSCCEPPDTAGSCGFIIRFILRFRMRTESINPLRQLMYPFGRDEKVRLRRYSTRKYLVWAR